MYLEELHQFKQNKKSQIGFTTQSSGQLEIKILDPLFHPYIPGLLCISVCVSVNRVFRRYVKCETSMNILNLIYLKKSRNLDT